MIMYNSWGVPINYCPLYYIYALTATICSVTTGILDKNKDINPFVPNAPFLYPPKNIRKP